MKPATKETPPVRCLVTWFCKKCGHLNSLTQDGAGPVDKVAGSCQKRHCSGVISDAGCCWVESMMFHTGKRRLGRRERGYEMLYGLIDSDSDDDDDDKKEVPLTLRKDENPWSYRNTYDIPGWGNIHMRFAKAAESFKPFLEAKKEIPDHTVARAAKDMFYGLRDLRNNTYRIEKRAKKLAPAKSEVVQDLTKGEPALVKVHVVGPMEDVESIGEEDKFKGSSKKAKRARKARNRASRNQTALDIVEKSGFMETPETPSMDKILQRPLRNKAVGLSVSPDFRRAPGNQCD